ncbi:SH3 domain-containing protein [Peribacillus glennii]|uniref:Peptide-binding protein n=1 Tax=Peribacillus glennii TaxID=2303991 RepID=A0A372LF28_9BACI|nr:SH3 domain-containing protein [Peribacillus glennii]RFU64923.1 peptide-binding protein [Peribacillus glennii]
MRKLGRAFILSSVIITGASTVPFGHEGVLIAEAASVKFSKTSFQTTANVNLRAGAGTKYNKVITIPKGKVVTSTEKNGSWYKVSYTYKSNGKNVTKTGWVVGSYLKEYYEYTSIAKSYYFTKKTTNLYPAPDTKKKQLYTVGMNNGFYSTQKIVNSKGQAWYRVAFKGKTVYVNGSDVTKNVFTSFTKTTYQAKKDSYLFEFYGNAHKKIVKIPKGATVSSNKRIGDWYLITYGGKTGYFYIGDFTKYVPPITYTFTNTNETYYFTKQTAKLYATADSRNKEVYAIPAGNGFASTQQAKNSLGELWYRVNYEGKDLYVNSKDVTSESFTTFAETKYIANKSTDLYASFGNAHKKLAEIPANTVVSSAKRIGDWYSVTYNGTLGYIYIDDFSKAINEVPIAASKLTYITTSAVAVKKSADEASEIITELPDLSVVSPTHKVSNGWYKISFDGKTGYVPGISLGITGDPMENRDGYQFIDLRTQSPVTAQQINDYITKNVANGKISILTNKGQLFIDAAKEYGVNALYLAAHAIHESGFGTSHIALGKNNLFGFGSFDASPYIASYRFSTVDSNIKYIAQQMKATYLNPASGNWRFKGAYLGFSTMDMNNKRIDSKSEGMNFYYATDPNWGKGIARHMQAILPYEKAYSTGAADPIVPKLPAIPVGSDVFPAGIQAKANKKLVLYSEKGATDSVLDLESGDEFYLLEKTNDYWIKVKVEDKIYWSNVKEFHKYKEYMSVLNLGRTLAINPKLNVRKEATTAAEVITQLNVNHYVQFVLEKDGAITRDASKNWYKIKLADGTIGWVSAQYVVQELK